MQLASSWKRQLVNGLDSIFFKGSLWFRVLPSLIEGSSDRGSAGNGLFAARSFLGGELMGYYDGVLCSEERGLTSRYVMKRMSEFVDGEHHFIGAANSARNSEQNNGEIRPTGGLISRKFIKSGTEITVPYGTGYWNHWGRVM